MKRGTRDRPHCGESDAVVDKRQGMERNASMEPFTEVKIEIYIPELLFDLIHGSDTGLVIR